MFDVFYPRGKQRVQSFDRSGNRVQDTGWMGNLVVTLGVEHMLDLWAGSGTNMTYVAFGVSGNTAQASNTALVAEKVRSVFTDTPTRAGQITSWESFIDYTEGNPATGDYDFNEMGVFNMVGVNSGVMFSRVYISPAISKNMETSILVEGKLTVS